LVIAVAVQRVILAARLGVPASAVGVADAASLYGRRRLRRVEVPAAACGRGSRK
jgi:hypothetical protein